MQNHEAELFLSRIIAGYLKISLYHNTKVVIRSATVDQDYMAQEVFYETYQLAKERGIFTSEDMLNIMIENDIWNTLDVRREEQIPKDIENIKVEMFKAAFRLQEREARRGVLRQMEEQYLKVRTKKHSYDFVTCEGLATYSRWNWLIENCTHFEDGTPFDWGSCGISSVLNKYRSQTLSDTQFRELARNDMWRSIWNAGKKEGSIFGIPAIELSQEQKSLSMWSSLYDSVYESPEAPAEEIVKDDDLLDGWLIHQRRKTEQEKKKQKAEGILGKNADKDDVFIMANSREDALEIESMNDDVGIMIKKERQIYKEQADGYVSDADLPDQRRRVMTQAREQFKNRR